MNAIYYIIYNILVYVVAMYTSRCGILVHYILHCHSILSVTSLPCSPWPPTPVSLTRACEILVVLRTTSNYSIPSFLRPLGNAQQPQRLRPPRSPNEFPVSACPSHFEGEAYAPPHSYSAYLCIALWFLIHSLIWTLLLYLYEYHTFTEY